MTARHQADAASPPEDGCSRLRAIRPDWGVLQIRLEEFVREPVVPVAGLLAGRRR